MFTIKWKYFSWNEEEILNYLKLRDEQEEYKKQLWKVILDGIIYLRYWKDYYCCPSQNKKLIFLGNILYILYKWEKEQDYEIWAVIFFDKKDYNKIKEDIIWFNNIWLQNFKLNRKWIKLFTF